MNIAMMTNEELQEVIAAAQAELDNRTEDITVSMDFSSYNERRFSRPWGAVITLNGTKLKYDFCGNFVSDKTGDEGTVFLKCKKGYIVAFGQKDGRGKNSVNDFYQVLPDGKLASIDKTDAVLYLQK